MKKKIMRGLLIAALLLVLPISGTLPVQNVVTVQAATVRLSNTKLTLIKGETKKIRVTGTKAKRTFSSSNAKVASVDENGNITAQKAGKAVITVKLKNKKLGCNVKVETPKLSAKTLKLKKGQKKTLTLKNTTLKVKWSSSDQKVATVKNGLVTAKKKGTAVITAKVNTKSYKTKVTVSNSTTVQTVDLSGIQTERTLEEFSSTSIGLASGAEKVHWKTSNKDVAQIAGGDIVALSPGKATITGTSGGNTVKIQVKVDSSISVKGVGLNTKKLTLYQGEKFRLIAGGASGTEKWTSSKTSVATVSSGGMVTAKATGKATVTVTVAGKKATCAVNVVKKDDTYLGSLTNKTPRVTTSRTLYQYDKFNLLADAGVYVPDSLEKDINKIMTAIEKETGYQFYPSKPAVTSLNHKILIYVLNDGETSAYANSDMACFAPSDISENVNSDVILHELTHTVQGRNSISVGEALTEGFAEMCVEQVYDKIATQKLHDEEWNQNSSMSMITPLTAENVENSLLNPEDSHPVSYFFVKYLREKYGKNKVKNVIDAITKEASKSSELEVWGNMICFSEKEIMEIIKKNTSSNVAKDFYSWYTKQEISTESPVYDLTDSSSMQVHYQSYAEDYLEGATIRYKNSIKVDLTPAITYGQLVKGRKYRGIRFNGYNANRGGIAKFYNSAGQLLETIELAQIGEGVEVEKATSMVVSGGDEVELNFDIDWMFN